MYCMGVYRRSPSRDTSSPYVWLLLRSFFPRALAIPLPRFLTVHVVRRRSYGLMRGVEGCDSPCFGEIWHTATSVGYAHHAFPYFDMPRGRKGTYTGTHSLAFWLALHRLRSSRTVAPQTPTTPLISANGCGWCWCLGAPGPCGPTPAPTNFVGGGGGESRLKPLLPAAQGVRRVGFTVYPQRSKANGL